MWIVAGIFLMCVASFGLAAMLAGPNPSEVLRDFSNCMKDAMRLCLIALLGLLSGRAMASGGVVGTAPQPDSEAKPP
jgi:hypothetical protein